MNRSTRREIRLALHRHFMEMRLFCWSRTRTASALRHRRSRYCTCPVILGRPWDTEFCLWAAISYQNHLPETIWRTKFGRLSEPSRQLAQMIALVVEFGGVKEQ